MFWENFTDFLGSLRKQHLKFRRKDNLANFKIYNGFNLKSRFNIYEQISRQDFPHKSITES